MMRKIEGHGYLQDSRSYPQDPRSENYLMVATVLLRDRGAGRGLLFLI